ncbi:CHAT domain-containing protein [Flagellimonas meridianipacifica]|uniref:CHAT domain-containing protein n=1 Tax=Flagellimonas meridianipacifica TaxID=1080225 RepID=A0A2T0MHZ9_9FLAO|nr:CHAT domain-containing protein [Allomuricauda pacifica]PRX57194.1 CHAT domain-containing protein [Allomuricauda pacifica]
MKPTPTQLLLCCLFIFLQSNTTVSQVTKDTLSIFQLKSEADTLFKSREFKKAARIYADAGKRYTSVHLWRRAAQCYNTEATCYTNTNEYDKMYAPLQKGLKILEANVEGPTYEEGRGYDLLSYYYELKFGDLEKSEAYLKKAISVFQQLPDEEMALAKAINNMIYLSNVQGQYTKAIRYAEKVLRSVKEKGTDYDDLKSMVYTNVANSHFRLGSYEAAGDYHKKALSMNRKIHGENHLTVANDYMNLGLLAKSMFTYKESITYLNKAEAIAKPILGNKHPFLANVYTNIAAVYHELNQPILGLEYAEKALSIWQGIHGKDHFAANTLLKDLSLLHYELGNIDLAIEYALRALKVCIATVGEDDEKSASAYDYLGTFHSSEGSFDVAKDYLLKALEIYGKKYPEGHRRLSGVHEGLAENYQNMGNDSLALVHWYKSLEINSKLFLQGNPKRVTDLLSIGDFYMTKNQIGNAHRLYNKALKELQNSSNGDTHANNKMYLKVYKKSATCYLETYKRDKNRKALKKSLALFRNADSIVGQMRGDISAFKDKISFSEQIQELYQDAIAANLLDNRKGESLLNTFYFAEKSKSNILKELLNDDKKVFAGLPNEILEVEHELKVKQAFYSSKMANATNNDRFMEQGEKVSNTFKDKLFYTNRAYDSLITTIASDYPNYFKFKYDTDILSVPQIQQRLNSNTSLLEYVVLESVAYVFVITKNGFQVKELIIKDLGQSIGAFNEAIALKNIGTYKRMGHELYSVLLAPIARELRGNELIIVPDGLLWNVNFELLLTGDIDSKDPKVLPYLLKDYAVSYANSATLLFGDTYQKERYRSECLAFSFSDSIGAATTDPIRLSAFRDIGGDLPGTRKEIRAISEIVDGEYFYGSQAVESNFKAKAGQYAILHLALHGEVDHEHPENSKLYFTNTKDTLEDNFLYSHELFALNLPADLAVLSACNTGTGKIASGEGVMSLGNAFQYAGTKSLLLSSWEVSDRVAPGIMKSFYRNLKKGMRKSEALQQAKLCYLQTADINRANPFYWGSFYVLGDNAPIDLGAPDYFLFGLIFLMVLIAIGGFLYQKSKASR